MPSHVISGSALERQLLVQLGGRLRAVRIHQGWTASQMAEKVGISRTTLASAEAGAASPAIGTYLKVVGAGPGKRSGAGGDERGHREGVIVENIGSSPMQTPSHSGRVSAPVTDRSPVRRRCDCHPGRSP